MYDPRRVCKGLFLRERLIGLPPTGDYISGTDFHNWTVSALGKTLTRRAVSGSRYWLGTLLVCAECGSNYIGDCDRRSGSARSTPTDTLE